MTSYSRIQTRHYFMGSSKFFGFPAIATNQSDALLKLPSFRSSWVPLWAACGVWVEIIPRSVARKGNSASTHLLDASNGRSSLPATGVEPMLSRSSGKANGIPSHKHVLHPHGMRTNHRLAGFRSYNTNGTSTQHSQLDRNKNSYWKQWSPLFPTIRFAVVTV
jgi:hypothetical protein